MPSPPLSILQSLSPRIAVLTSEDVVKSSQENGCAGLHELLRPWEGGTDRVSILSTTLTPTVHPTFPVRFVSYDTVYTNPARSAPSPDVLVDIISSVVGAKEPKDEQHYPLTRSLLLSSRPVAPYETFNHPVGVLFAVSTSTPDHTVLRLRSIRLIASVRMSYLRVLNGHMGPTQHYWSSILRSTVGQYHHHPIHPLILPSSSPAHSHRKMQILQRCHRSMLQLCRP